MKHFGISSMLEESYSDDLDQDVATEMSKNDDHILLEIDRVKSEIEGDNVSDRTIAALQYILENLKYDVESFDKPSDEENVKENAHGVVRQVPVEHQVKKEGEEELESVEDDVLSIIKKSGYFQENK